MYFISFEFFLGVGEAGGLFELLLEFVDAVLENLLFPIALELIGLEFLHLPFVGQALFAGLGV